MKLPNTVLCLDIGSYTQDALLYIEGMPEQNLPRFVLPSPARRLAQKISAAGSAGKAVYIGGVNMGGGFHRAIDENLSRGLAVAMHPEAAFALTDTPAKLEEKGITLAVECPEGYAALVAEDYSPEFWRGLLRGADLPEPELTLAAAQDHGFAPGESSRRRRMDMWRQLLRSSGVSGGQYSGAPLTAFMQKTVDASMTRLSVIQARSHGPVMDSVSAALLGVASIPEVAEQSYRQGVLVVNAGNSHISAFLTFKGRVYGIYEHHTGLIEGPELFRQLKDFRLGWLPDEEVFDGGGHGVALLPLPPEAEGFAPAFVVGPRREIFRGQGKFVAPHGDMMQNGGFGLLHAARLLEE